VETLRPSSAFLRRRLPSHLFLFQADFLLIAAAATPAATMPFPPYLFDATPHVAHFRHARMSPPQASPSAPRVYAGFATYYGSEAVLLLPDVCLMLNPLNPRGGCRFSSFSSPLCLAEEARFFCVVACRQRRSSLSGSEAFAACFRACSSSFAAPSGVEVVSRPGCRLHEGIARRGRGG